MATIQYSHCGSPMRMMDKWWECGWGRDPGDHLAASLGTGQSGPKCGRRLHADIFCDRDEHLGGKGPVAVFRPLRAGEYGAAVGLRRKREGFSGSAGRGLSQGGELLDGGGVGGHRHPRPADQDWRSGFGGGHRHDEAVAGHGGRQCAGAARC